MGLRGKLTDFILRRGALPAISFENSDPGFGLIPKGQRFDFDWLRNSIVNGASRARSERAKPGYSLFL
jgi:hypothetical protein